MKRTVTLARGYSMVDRVFPQCAQSPNFHLLYCIDGVWWHGPIIPALWKQKNQKAQSHLLAHMEFKASLGYMGSCLKNKKEGKKLQRNPVSKLHPTPPKKRKGERMEGVKERTRESSTRQGYRETPNMLHTEFLLARRPSSLIVKPMD